MRNYQNIIHEEFVQKNTHVMTIVYKGCADREGCKFLWNFFFILFYFP
jgi:hypothetical protein